MVKRLKSVAIFGVGLIGGSIGMALRGRKLADEVIGIGRSSTRLRQAVGRGAIDRFTTELAKGVAESDIVVICTPVDRIAEHVREVAAVCPKSTLITDAGSTKAAIVRDVSSLINQPVFIGSHPLAGSHATGVAAARADLLEGSHVVVTPLPRHRQADVKRLEQFWRSLGADVLQMTASRHDAALAQISHLPHVIASVLAASTAPRHLALAATGWRDTTRIAGGSPELWLPILQQNKSQVLKSLDKFATTLTSLREALEADDDKTISRILEKGRQHRDAVGG